MTEESESKCGIEKIMVLSRLEFFSEMKAVLRGKKSPLAASGLVHVSDVLDFTFDLGLEEAMLFSFDEDSDGYSDTTLSSSDDDKDLAEVSDIE